MSSADTIVQRPGMSEARAVTLPARPEPIRVSADDTAVVAIDMQNAKVLTVARAAKMPVIYFQNGWDAAYIEAGGPGSPNFHKSNALKTMRIRPELHGQLLARGAGTMSWWTR